MSRPIVPPLEVFRRENAMEVPSGYRRATELH
jgi:hypothetical protein